MGNENVNRACSDHACNAAHGRRLTALYLRGAIELIRDLLIEGTGALGADERRDLLQEAKNCKLVPLQENFKARQKYLSRPLKQRYEISPGQGKMGHFSPPESCSCRTRR